MVEVAMSDDIRKYEMKNFGPFTARQWICIIIGIICALPVLIFVHIEASNRLLLAFICAMPAIICGFVSVDGATPEILAIRWVYSHFMTPAKRKMISKNTYREMLEDDFKEREMKAMTQMSSAERKQYEKKKSRAPVVKYSQKEKYKVFV